MQQPSPSEETANLLARLAQRPGVQGTLILSRETGAIVRTSGLATEEEDGEGDSGAVVNGADGALKSKGTRKAEEVARLVWTFVQSAGQMIESLNGENDEAKLLRVRTKRNELVVVPGMFPFKRSFFLHALILFDIRREVPFGRDSRNTASLSSHVRKIPVTRLCSRSPVSCTCTESFFRLWLSRTVCRTQHYSTQSSQDHAEQ